MCPFLEACAEQHQRGPSSTTDVFAAALRRRRLAGPVLAPEAANIVTRQLARDSRDAEDAVMPGTGDLEFGNTMERDIPTGADVAEGFVNILSDLLEMAPFGGAALSRTRTDILCLWLARSHWVVGLIDEIVSDSPLILRNRGPLECSCQGLANMEAAQAAWLRYLDLSPSGLGPGSSVLQQVCVAVGNPATFIDATAMVGMHVHDTFVGADLVQCSGCARTRAPAAKAGCCGRSGCAGDAAPYPSIVPDGAMLSPHMTGRKDATRDYVYPAPLPGTLSGTRSGARSSDCS
ncbi:unnamed protein product [Prorocentrum cordatum]|uniref:Uncharacterized protein n=1 Tax=Prorocentrum cordatum TaxID=2364126 RepID=A0ABN9UF42_9DINO|nr:unnamed protein product [Polarella glacialis]